MAPFQGGPFATNPHFREAVTTFRVEPHMFATRLSLMAMTIQLMFCHLGSQEPNESQRTSQNCPTTLVDGPNPGMDLYKTPGMGLFPTEPRHSDPRSDFAPVGLLQDPQLQQVHRALHALCGGLSDVARGASMALIAQSPVIEERKGGGSLHLARSCLWVSGHTGFRV